MFSPARLFLIITLLTSSVLFAAESDLDLEYIKLSDSFLKALAKDQNSVQKSRTLGDVSPSVQESLIPFLFNDEIARSHKLMRSRKNLKKSHISDGQQSLIYEEIRGWLDSRYQEIGGNEANQVNFLNQQFPNSVLNFSGFSWQKPFGGFSLHVNRQLSPDILDSERWIIMDTFTIVIEASGFLGKLTEAGAINMTSTELAGFAGINFKRVYTTYHFADSYLNGLVSDFRPLFMPFLYYTPERAINLEAGQVLRREDTWSAGVGGLIESPPWYGLSFNAGILAEITHQSTLTMQNMTESSQKEFLRIGKETSLKKKAGVTAGLQLDFFKLIKFALFTYDLEFEREKNQEVTLSFKHTEKEKLVDGSATSEEFRQLLRAKQSKLVHLEPYVIKLDEGESSSTNQRVMILLKGSLKKSNFEQIKVIKDQEVKSFFKSYSETIKLVQNFWSRLFSSVIFRIFNFSSTIKNDAAFGKKLQIEYEATLPQSSNPKKMTIESSELFSMTANLSYQAAKTHRWIDRSYRRDTESFMHRFTTLPTNLRGMVRNEQLRGPLSVTTNIRVMKDGLDYFNQLSTEAIKREFSYICQKKASCIKNLLGHYESYKKILTVHQNHELIHMKRLMENILRDVHDLASFQVLFGESTFVSGQFTATTSAGALFTTQYSLGEFKGLGIIDTYQRLNGTRQPASIWEE
jgi:hypothetical protein